ncbi:MAG: glucan endo-1,6-beta-glucosidase [Prevotellaceae bacterium]|jgi:glucosylceramidase|nr:glucan endo-1,6-beta-glucosidase [Prevotellaceae bacterium]
MNYELIRQQLKNCRLLTVACLLATALCFLATACSENKKGGGDDTENGHDVSVYLTVRHSNIRLTEQNGISFSDAPASGLTVTLDTADVKQEIEGFGAALTGSSACLMKNMTGAARQKLLKDLFTEEGIDMKYMRLCIGTSDFSLGNYTYCDDCSPTDLSHFGIPELDRRDLLPVLKEILALQPHMRLLGSPWTAPAWMKTNNALYGGYFKTDPAVYNALAQYFVKYVQAYAAEGITIDAITLQNEPWHEINTYATMKMEPNQQRDVVRDYLGPQFEAEGIATQIQIWDHNFGEVQYPLAVLADADARKYVDGVAFHGYSGSPANLDQLIAEYPGMPIYFTEQSGGGWNTDDPVGNMLYYMKDFIIPTINRGSRNFLMWNLALDLNAGPKVEGLGGCGDCRGVVTIQGNSYRVNEEYYLLGHFSKFVKAGAHRIGYTLSAARPDNVDFSTFLNPDGSKVVVAVNQSGAAQTFTVRTGNKLFSYTLSDQSSVTLITKNYE